MRFAVVYGSVRTERQGIRAARFMERKLKERKHAVTLIDPKELKLPLLDRRYWEFEKPPRAMEEIHNILQAADAFVVVTGEYNASVPPALKNLLDHFRTEYARKPAAIASYSSGPFAGRRAAEALRPILSNLGMVSTPMEFLVPKVQDAFDGEGNALDRAFDERAEKFLDELEWYAQALKAARPEPSVPED